MSQISYFPKPGYHVCAVHARPDGKGGYRKDYTYIKTEKAQRAESAPEPTPARTVGERRAKQNQGVLL